MKLQVSQAAHRAFILMDRDFPSMTRVSTATATRIEFQLDSNRLPNYNPNAPSAIPTIPVGESPDVDGDQFVRPTPAIPVWSVGDNLVDEDDDGDVRIDVQCRYELRGTDLIRDFNFNEGGWGRNESVIVERVQSLRFDYFSYTNTAGNVSFVTNSEGLVEGLTVDGSAAYGNNDGIPWNTQRERDRVDMVRVTLGFNPRDPTKTISSDFAPNFLIIRRGQF